MSKKLILAALFAALAGGSAPLAAQSPPPGKIGIQIRVGATGFSPLVQDRVRSSQIADSIDARISSELTITQQVAPTIAVAALLPLRPRLDLEVSASFARSGLEGESDFATWDAGHASFFNALVGLAFRYRAPLVVHGGVGLTRLSADDDVNFMQGGSTQPLVEGGVAWQPWTRSGLQLDARVQAHRFGSAALRAQGAEDGGVLRIAVTGSYTFGRGMP